MATETVTVTIRNEHRDIVEAFKNDPNKCGHDSDSLIIQWALEVAHCKKFGIDAFDELMAKHGL